MNTLQAGFSRVNVTPMLGIPIAGYFVPRYAEGVLDELEVNALALSDGKKTVVVMAVDHCGLMTNILDNFRAHISEVAGIPADAIFIHSTHTHTGPKLELNSEDPLIQEYYQFLYNKVADAAVMAINDLKPAKMGWAVGKAPNIAFVRRFRMKDGKVRTNPGVGNPDILHPIGDIDERVNVTYTTL